jgi:hypothetical protein
MQPISLQQALAGAVVRVELVCDREFKDDCRANTGIVWRGQGDIQPYPASLWPKLAAHPDVWRLADDQGEGAVPVDKVRSESLEDERRRLNVAEAERVAKASETKASAQSAEEAAAAAEAAVVAAQAAADAARVEADARQAELAGQGTDSVIATLPDQAFAEAFDYSTLTPEAQAGMEYHAMRDLAAQLDYGLNYRLGEKNLRLRFAEITQERIEQKDEAGDTTGVDE